MADLKLKRNKCNFFKCELHYLGSLISRKGMYPLPEKLLSIENLSMQKILKEERQTLGLTGYSHKFLPVYTALVRPLTQLTEKTAPFIWTDQC